MIINPFIFGGGGGGGPFGGLVDTTNLVEWWPLSESSGTRVGVHAGLDLSDNNTVTGTTGPDGSGASQFTAANSEYLKRLSETALQAGDIDFTFCAWFKCDTLSSLRAIVAKYSADAGSLEYMLYVITDGRISFMVGRPTDVQKQAILVAGTISTGTWYMACGWHDAAADTVNLEINANGTIATTATGGALQAASVHPFTIGQRAYTASELFHDGGIQRVGFWKRVLTSDERTALYNSGNGLDY